MDAPRCRALKLVDFEEITQFGFSSLWQRTNVKKWTACKGKSLPKKQGGKLQNVNLICPSLFEHIQ